MTRCRVIGLGAVLAGAALTVAGCTAGGHGVSGPTYRVSIGVRSVPPAEPVSAGPTRSAQASSCPFVGQGYVHRTMGMRLGRITVQRSGATVVGCRFYALQGGPLHRSEHLPGPHQPAVEIATTRWRTATEAHNVFVRLAELGTNATRANLGGGRVGVCFQTAFDAADHGQDYACAGSAGVVEFEVRSVDTTGTFDTVAVTRKVLDALAS